ncbi:MAG: alkaline phosphatase family protein [Actinomycetota bacterium]
MPPRLVVLGWDSATYDVVDPLIERGRLPALAGLLERGFRAPLRSTWPPMTDCAWTSAFTGQNAGHHGIFGSWYRAPGAYACRYFSARDRRAPAVWEMTPDLRWLVWNVPMTFPPAAVNGVMVAGYGAPPGARFTAPASFQDELAERWRIEDLLDRAPHASLEAFLNQLLAGLEAQAEAVPWAAREVGADAVVAVWPHVDRAQHFFWRFRGTSHPLSGAVDRVYEAMDKATAAVVAAFPDADVMVVSDHGAGPLYGDVNLGAWLARRGDAAYARGRRKGLSDVAWAMPPSVRKLGRRAAPGLARRAMGAKLTGQLAPFDWTRTRAFLGFHSDLWLNLQGREPDGTVAPADASAVVEELRNDLLTLTDPRTGADVFAGAHTRDEIFSGPHADMAPDLMLDTWSAGYRVAPGRDDSDDVVVGPASLAGVDEAWSSDHRPLGIFAAAGPRIEKGAAGELALYDVCPTSLALLDQVVPSGLDGAVAEDALSASFKEVSPVRFGDAAPAPSSSDDAFSDEEADAVAAHLKDLGYIE